MSKEQKNSTSSSDSLASKVVPSVLMLMGKQCTFCLPMMQVLSELMKAGEIAELRIVSIEENPDLAEKLGVRSVPWVQIGPFELLGSRSKKELSIWLQRASSSEGISEYLEEILIEGNIQAANKLIDNYPQALQSVIALMANPEAKINVRLGVGVIIEKLAETDEFKMVIPDLLSLLEHADARVRGDACHYLSLTNDISHISRMETLLIDDSDEVREIAQESIDELQSKE